jgi:uncharacterized protein (DUF342 family)
VSPPRITIDVSSDAMSAVAKVVPGPAGGKGDISAALQRVRVSVGVDTEACRQLAAALQDSSYATPGLAVASGVPAVPSRDESFEPAFTAGLLPGRLLDDGRMDFFDRELLKPVTRGQPIGVLRPAQRGTPGMRVDGQSLPVAEPRPLALECGPGVRVEENGRICAARAGVVVYVAGKSLDVVDHHVHRGDVDLRSGHLDMQGSLSIDGDVQRAFNVRATGDIEIKGNVESGIVTAGGHVKVHGVIRGGHEGSVHARGDLTAHQTQGATLVAGGTIALDGALHCQLAAVAIQARQTLRGGSVRAERSIHSRDAGAPHGSTATVLAAGEALPNLLEQAHWAQGMQKQQRAAERLAGTSTRGNGDRAKGGKLGRIAAERHKAELERKIALRQRSRELLPLAAIEITGTAHEGLTIAMGDARLVLERPMQQVRFTFDLDSASIQARGLEP